jgi:hypothetical protein
MNPMPLAVDRAGRAIYDGSLVRLLDPRPDPPYWVRTGRTARVAGIDLGRGGEFLVCASDGGLILAVPRWVEVVAEGEDPCP